jgi:tRNA A37 threonylcarbamoyladenosine dehydratase
MVNLAMDVSLANSSSAADAEERRFGGLRRLYGDAAYQRIRAARVAVVGIGGVGSWAAEALARSGVAQLVLIDFDHVAESNINRQVHATDATLGQSKGEAMRDRIRGIHPGCVVTVVDDFATPDNWPGLLQAAAPDGVDAVLDACDQAEAKVTMAAWALEPAQKALQFVMVGAAGGKQRAECVARADLAHTTHDPLLASVRARLRQQHGAPAGAASPAKASPRIGIDCVFSSEPMARGSAEAGNLSCAGYGSVVSVTATFGLVAAGAILLGFAERVKTTLPQA